MVELVYHTDESRSGGRSPFDETIRELTAGEDVLLASPYINLDYLESILADAASWRVLTDMESWLGSEHSKTRERIREFVTQHHEDVHDVRDLHAKAIVAGDSALVGSANFTRKGLAGRDELAVSLTEPELIDELRDWFDELWLSSSPATLDKLDEFINTSPSTSRDAARQPTASIPSDAPRVRSTLASVTERTQGASESTEDPDAHHRLVEYVSEAPSRRWIDCHFDLLEELLTVTGLSGDNPRLVTSIRADKRMNSSINRRVALGIYPAGARTTFILPDSIDRLEQLISDSLWHHSLEQKNEASSPHLFQFDDGLKRIADPSFRRNWLEAALREVRRGNRSPYRRHHEPVVYKAAVDHRFRQRILEEAF